MNLTPKIESLILQVEENRNLIKTSLKSLNYSYEKCQKIGLKENYNAEELESFEALTSRFARTSNILTKKVFKTLFILLQEDIKTFIDAANFLEKIEIIKNASQILSIRELRNEISHEYKDMDLKILFKEVISYIPELIKIIKNTNKYIDEKFEIIRR